MGHAIGLGGDGTAFIGGRLGTNPTFGTPRFALRSLGGPTGLPQDVPGPLNGGTFETVPTIAYAANGDALLTNGRQVAFRPAGAGSAIGPAQDISATSGLVAEVMSVAPSGEAIVAGGGNPSSIPNKLGFRPAGASAQVSLANLQDLGPGRMIGAVLDPDGAAIVVWTQDNTLYQAVRAAGQPSFASPTTVPNPGGLSPGPVPAHVRVRSPPGTR